MKRNNGPLRLIIEHLGYATNVYEMEPVIFECGHRGRATPGAVRGRCWRCGRQEKAPEP